MHEGLFVAALTGLATAVGAFPFFFVKELPRRVYDGVLGFGAGLMLAAATLGLLAEALHDVRGPAGVDVERVVLVIVGFVTGAGLAAVMDRFIPHRHARGHHHHIGPHGHDDQHHLHQHGDRWRTYAIIGALTIHRVPEGLAIGAGYASDRGRLGLLLAVAVALQNACEGMVMGAPLRASGVSALRGLLVVGLTGLAIPFGALVGHMLSVGALRALPLILALAAGALIYVTSNEIIPESHSHGHEGTASAGLVAGFLATTIISALLH